MYIHFFKRFFDIVLSFIALVILSPVLLVVSILVRTKLGSPVIFKQQRPGKIDRKTGKEKIFTLYKFRTMTDAKDENGNLLPDDVRLTKFGKMLRETSLDELPELWNIFIGDMSLVGPRPQLVRDMVFMSSEQRRRHSVTPGLTGWAQVNGRNAISWENKINLDLEYVEHIGFFHDIKIIFMTVGKVLKHSDITEDGSETATDFGDYLLASGKISLDCYNEKQEEAKLLCEGRQV